MVLLPNLSLRFLNFFRFLHFSTCSTNGCLFILSCAMSRFFINDFICLFIHGRWSCCFMSFVGTYFFIPIPIAVFSSFQSSFAFLVAKFIRNLVRCALKLSLSVCLCRKILRGCFWFAYGIVFISVNIA